MKSKTEKTFLNYSHFTIFGFGDKTFRKVNTPAKKYNEYFIENKMICYYPLGLGDDQFGNVEKDFIKWKKELVIKIFKSKGIE